MYRDLTMKEISEQQIGQTLQVAGWVENIRDHGGAAHAHASAPVERDAGAPSDCAHAPGWAP